MQLILAASSIAMGFSLNLLIAENTGGGSTISYNSPAYLRGRHALPQELVAATVVIETLVAKVAEISFVMD